MTPGEQMPWNWPMDMDPRQRRQREERLQMELAQRRMQMFGHLPGSTWRTAEGLRI